MEDSMKRQENEKEAFRHLRRCVEEAASMSDTALFLFADGMAGNGDRLASIDAILCDLEERNVEIRKQLAMFAGLMGLGGTETEGRD